MKKITVLLVLAMMLATLLVGCASPTQTPDETTSQGSEQTTATEEAATAPSGRSGGVLNGGEYVLDTQMANLNPFATSGTWLGFFNFMYEELLYYNPVSGQLEPSLATGYTWSDDYLTLSLPINKEAAWTDGTPFSVNDAVYSFNVLHDNPVLDQYGIWASLDSVSADGDTVVFHLKQPSTALPNYISTVQIVPEHLWKDVNPVEFTNPEPIGTGPFIFTAYNTGTDVQFDANMDYWRGAPNVDKIVMHIYNSAPNLTLALLKGDIQFTQGTLAMPNVPELRTKQGAELQVYSGLTNWVVAMNEDNPMLADVAVRKAMAMAINQTDLITKGEYNGVFPTSIGWLPPLFGDLVNTEVANSLTYDIAAAQAVLEEAGYTKGDDGIYQKDGQRLSFTYHNASGAPAQQMEAGMIQQWLLNLGVEIIPKLATWPELTKRGQTGDFDLIQLPITFPPDAFASINASFNSAMTAPSGTATPGTNYFRFSNAKVDELLAQAASVTDPAEQKTIYYELQQEIAANYVFLPMYSGGGHIPYYEGVGTTGWDTNYPIWAAQSLIKVQLIP
ncbi:MAG: peptide ABC transporter substrate-binding protein [Anaerolineales bacterium]|nr:peptide ABC transporter substrate-binding protein [Anaerolineales bacterium]